MGLHYKNTVAAVLIGSKSGTTRTPVALTSSYDVANKTKIFETDGYSKLNLDISYTTGSGETNNSIEIRVENSPDRTNFYRIPNDSTSDGTSTLTQREFTFVGASAATEYNISLGIDIFYPYMRISVKESGVASNAGTIFVESTLMGV